MIAFKLMRLRKDGSLGSLFINRRASVPIGKWLKARNHPTEGFAIRPGWHCTLKPVAPHLSEKDRVWAKVEVKNYQFFERPVNQGGKWVLAKEMRVKEILREG